MTMIVRGYATKKALKEAVKADPCSIRVEDPAVMKEWLKYGYSDFTLDYMKAGDSFCCTNHPKRSWFAEIKCLGNGKYKVS